MDRFRAPPRLVFAAVSLAIHSAALGALKASRRPPVPAFRSEGEPLAGDTLDVDLPAPAPSEEDPEAIQTTPPSAEGPRPRRATPHDRGASAGTAGTAGPAPSQAQPQVFGAVGVRYAADLATTFTRAIPQAASADPVWLSAPFGNAGIADLTLDVDEDGHLAGHAIAGAPSEALRRAVERTLVLLGARPFTARGAVTRLRLSARVSRDDVHDGLHGDVFALSGGSFSGDVGSAFFALPPGAGAGRRIDVEVRLLP